jgi:hypothetical protein
MDQHTPSFLDRWFLAHPRSICTSYFGHMLGAFAISGRMFGTSLACLIHAFVPGLFEKAATVTVTDLDREFTSRRANMANDLGL